jgi:hypothetical protein
VRLYLLKSVLMIWNSCRSKTSVSALTCRRFSRSVALQRPEPPWLFKQMKIEKTRTLSGVAAQRPCNVFFLFAIFFIPNDFLFLLNWRLSLCQQQQFIH